MENVHSIAIVDDDPALRALVRTHLRLTGQFDVVGEGSTGHDAIALADHLQPDLLLLDVSMPDMDGLAALPGIRSVAPHTSVVMLSGFDEQKLVEQTRQLGAREFLSKQLPVEQLVQCLRDTALRNAGATEDSSAGSRATGTAPAETIDTKAALAEHPEDFHQVFDQATLGMATVTLAGRLVRVNRAFEDLVGQGAHDLVGRNYAEVIDTGAVPVLDDAIAALARGTRQLSRFEHRLSGQLTDRTVLSTLAVVSDPRSRPLYLFLQAQDITEQRTAQVALARSEDRFRVLVEGVADYAIFMLDPAGRIATWNRGAQRIKGYAAEEAIGQHFRLFYTEEAKVAEHPEYELDVAVREGRYEEEGWRVRKDGSLFRANVVITALRGEEGELLGFGKVTRDITERQRMLEERERAAAELLVSRQLAEVAAEKAQFVAVTAHELRNPIAVVAGSAQTLRDHWQRLEDSERDALLEAMATGGKRMRRLLEDLLTATRLESGAIELHPQRCPVTTLVEQATAETAPLLASTPLDVECSSELEVVADPHWTQQILKNYISNAARYGSPPVRLQARRVNGAVEVRVSDRGPGIPDDLLPRLFTKFARGRRDVGTGLGLFIVRELSRAQGGDAWYEPVPSGGASFAFRLPAVTG